MKKIFSIFFILAIFLPSEALASTQVFMGSVISQNTQTTYALLAVNGGNNSGVRSDALPVSGVISNLTAHSTVLPTGSTGKVLTLAVNGVDTALTCTITNSGNNCTDSTHSVSVSAGDYLMMHVANPGGGSPGTSGYSWSVEFSPTNANDTVLLGSVQNNGTKSTTYLPFSGFSQNTNEISSQTLIPEAGTLDTFLVNVPAAVDTYEYTISQNGSSSTLDCTITAGNTGCTDSTHSVSVSAGDSLSVLMTAFTAVANTRPGFGVRYLPTTAGDFAVLAGATNQSDSAGNTVYFPFSGNMTGTTLGTLAEGDAQQIVGTAMTVKSITVGNANAAGAGKTRVFKLRVNGSDSSLSCTISNTTTPQTCTGSVSLNPGDLVNWSDTLTAAGTTGRIYASAVVSTVTGSTPTVTTDNATAVGANSAVLNATIDNNGGSDATEHGFAYSTNSALSSSVSTTTDGSFTGTGYFNDLLNSLSTDTTYYFRAYATNGSGTGYGGIMSFFTGTTSPNRGIVLFNGAKINVSSGRVILY